MELQDFCYQASRRIMAGLQQELNISPNVHYRPSGYNSSRVLSLRLVGINPSYYPKVRGMQTQLTFWAGLSDEYKVRIGHNSSAVIIEVPKPKTFWKRVTIEQLEQRHFIRRGAIATIGLGLQDNPKRIDFNQEAMAHVLISGQTRSGKTNTQRLISWNLAHNTTPQDARLIIFDVAKRGYRWSDFGSVAHLAHPLVTDVQEANGVLAWLDQEIEKRAIGRYTLPKIFTVIDELKALTDDSNVATDYLARIASVGGEFGLHLVLATQYPQIKLLGSSELKRNVTTRLCGKVDDAQAATNALGVKDSGAETLGGYGDFLLRDTESLSRLTVAHIERQHVETLERGEINRLELPESDVINNGPKSSRQPDDLEPEQVALALFQPMPINRLQSVLSIGGNKATRIKRFADGIRQWALDNDYNCIERG